MEILSTWRLNEGNEDLCSVVEKRRAESPLISSYHKYLNMGANPHTVYIYARCRGVWLHA